jgi:hypothetical protein
MTDKLLKIGASIPSGITCSLGRPAAGTLVPGVIPGIAVFSNAR